MQDPVLSVPGFVIFIVKCMNYNNTNVKTFDVSNIIGRAAVQSSRKFYRLTIKKKYTRDTVGVQEYIPHLLTKIENQFINHFY